jgi:hypothetical protein
MRAVALCLVLLASATVVGACVDDSGDGADGGDSGNGVGGAGGAAENGGGAGAAENGGGAGAAENGGAGGGGDASGGEAAAPNPGSGGSTNGSRGAAGSTATEPPVGGEAGDGNQPTECLLVDKLVETSRCFGSYTCGEKSIGVYCDESSLGMDCRCTGTVTEPTSAGIVGSSGYEPCEIMLAVCANPDERGDEECQHPDFGDATFCAGDAPCVRTFPTAAGGVATVARSIHIDCGLLSNAIEPPFYCHCEDRDYLLDEFSEETCGALADGCIDPKLGIDGPTECHPADGNAPSDTRCQFNLRCTTPIGAGGAVRRFVDEAVAVCNERPSGGGECWCRRGEAGAYFETDRPATPETCEEFARSCADASEIVFDGPIECRTTSERVNTECAFSGVCTRAGAMGDETIIGTAPLAVTCTSGSEGSWDCACRSGAPSSTPTNLALDVNDADSACRAAFDQCSTVVDFRFGEAGAD